jgi:AGCS family alanine or glycine:cation symporter
VALLLLSGVAARETRKYLWSNRLDEEMKEESGKWKEERE